MKTVLIELILQREHIKRDFVRYKTVKWKMRSAECGVRSAECGECGVWKMRSVENAQCGK